MWKLNTKIFKYTAIVLVLGVFLGAGYFMVFYKNFGDPRVALEASTDFTYTQAFLQNNSAEKPVLSTAEVPAVKIPIIIYHSVRPHIPGESIMQDRFDITPELFEEQLIYLRDHKYTTISMDEVARDTKEGTTTPTQKPVALTFDDGLVNQYQYAFPLLKKYGMTATFYVYTNPINRGNKRYLSWDEVREMSTTGMTIGSHSLSHSLFKNSTPADIKKEISESKKVIEDNIKKPVTDFAQPFGYTSPEIETVIKEAGYTTARGIPWGTLHSSKDLFHLSGYFTSDNFKDFVRIVGK